jgi:hypothetical protein
MAGAGRAVGVGVGVARGVGVGVGVIRGVGRGSGVAVTRGLGVGVGAAIGGDAVGVGAGVSCGTGVGCGVGRDDGRLKSSSPGIGCPGAGLVVCAITGSADAPASSTATAPALAHREMIMDPVLIKSSFAAP